MIVNIRIPWKPWVPRSFQCSESRALEDIPCRSPWRLLIQRLLKTTVDSTWQMQGAQVVTPSPHPICRGCPDLQGFSAAPKNTAHWPETEARREDARLGCPIGLQMWRRQRTPQRGPSVHGRKAPWGGVFHCQVLSAVRLDLVTNRWGSWGCPQPSFWSSGLTPGEALLLSGRRWASLEVLLVSSKWLFETICFVVCGLILTPEVHRTGLM